jgi:hypothetical protein
LEKKEILKGRMKLSTRVWEIRFGKLLLENLLWTRYIWIVNKGGRKSLDTLTREW